MKYLITESQYKKLQESSEKVLKLPSVEIFGDWDTMQRFLEKKGNPLYSIDGNLDLSYADISSLGNLISVGGNFELRRTKISSLGNLISIGGDFDLYGTDISSLGNLTSVGGNLDLGKTPLSKKLSETEIRDLVNVGGYIFL